MAFKAHVACMFFPVVAARISYPTTLAELTERQLQDDGEGDCHGCDCFKCVKGSVKDLGDGNLEVTVGHCKKSYRQNTIGWMCCTKSDGAGGLCSLAPNSQCNHKESGGQFEKCSGVRSDGFKVAVPNDATSFTINTHDKLTAGNANLGNAKCGGQGNQEGSCMFTFGKDTSHCLVDFKLEQDCGWTPTPASSPVAIPVVPPPTPGGAGGDPVGSVIDGCMHECRGAWSHNSNSSFSHLRHVKPWGGHTFNESFPSSNRQACVASTEVSDRLCLFWFTAVPWWLRPRFG
jgi:hypothetical protein